MSRRFWIGHAVLPAVAVVPCLFWIRATGADFRLAHSLFYDAATHAWLGTGAWWAELVHEGGRALVASVGIGALFVSIAGRFVQRGSAVRRDAVFVVAAIALSTGIVGLLKQVTDVDCPWDLTDFGGTHAFVGLFGHRPPALSRSECFPGAHSAAGFSLVCFYFVLRDTQPRAAMAALIAALLTGGLFAYAQEARGAHFLSHDLTSVVVVWYVQLALYGVVRPIDFRSTGRLYAGCRQLRLKPGNMHD